MESKEHNKQTKQRIIENRLMVTRREGVGGLGEKDKKIKKYRLVVTK